MNTQPNTEETKHAKRGWLDRVGSTRVGNGAAEVFCLRIVAEGAAWVGNVCFLN